MASVVANAIEWTEEACSHEQRAALKKVAWGEESWHTASDRTAPAAMGSVYFAASSNAVGLISASIFAPSIFAFVRLS
jgi:hypothetical protein